MVIHAIASYNTSWMGDFGQIVPFASEKHLYTNQKPQPSRKYFVNAVNNALHFWKNIKDASVIGFQEMNDQAFVKKTNADFPGGFQFIIEEFVEKGPDSDDIMWESHCVNSGPARPCLLTIWKPSKVGNKIDQYGSDLVYDVSGNKQTGRPIQIIFTDKQYYLINLHSPNHGSQSLAGMPLLRQAINEHLLKAREQFNDKRNIGLIRKKIIITGDFNDPYNGINNTNKLNILGNDYSYGEAPAPKTCCYNFNSSCAKSIFGTTSIDEIKPRNRRLLQYDDSKGDTMIWNKNECPIVQGKRVQQVDQDGNPKTDKDGKPIMGTDKDSRLRDMTVGPNSEPRTMGNRGFLKNYQFTGDYCFTSAENNIILPLSIYRTIPRSYSNESDHEMVYLIFELTASNRKSKRNSARNGGYARRRNSLRKSINRYIK